MRRHDQAHQTDCAVQEGIPAGDRGDKEGGRRAKGGLEPFPAFCFPAHRSPHPSGLTSSLRECAIIGDEGRTNMRVFLVGVCHHDPLGRQYVRVALQELGQANKEKPAFVGVEWARAMFEAIRSERPGYSELLRQAWPQLSPEALKTLELSLAYEADSHQSVFPDAKVIWLDENRPDGQDKDMRIPRCLPQQRLSHYRCLLGTEEMPSSASAVGEMLRQKSWVRARKDEADGMPPHDGRRDACWKESLMPAIEDGGSWAVCIIGEAHTLDKPGRLRSLLAQQNVDCVVRSLGPCPV